MTSRPRAAGVAAGLGLVAASLTVATAPALANPDGTDLVISEVYGGGGNSGATYTHDFIELYNPTGAPIRVDGWSVQYRSATGTAATVTPLCGVVPAGGHYLVQQAAGSGGTTPLPTPDATGSATMSGTNGVVLLVDSTTGVTSTGDLAGSDAVVDAVGYGSTPTTYETANTGVALTNTTAAARNATGGDTDHNANDFTEGAPSPQNDGDQQSGACLPPPVSEATIAEIQGTGSGSPLAGQRVRTRGVVTAAYPTGAFWAFVIQTEGTGAGEDATPGASDAVWVFQTRGGVDAQVGQFVEVTGQVSERFGRTQLTYNPEDTPLAVLTEPHDPVTALATAYPTTAGEREAHESELLDVSDQDFTVSNNFFTNEFGEIGLATGHKPLVTPTEVANPRLDPAAVQAAVADNFARGVVLDDGSDWNYLDDARNQDEPLPWLSKANPARVGAPATVVGPVILDFGFGDWRFQPTSQVTDEGRDVVSFGDTRTENQQPQDVGGDLQIATFNVLNYFNTTGKDFEEAGGTCTYHLDRAGDELTTNRCEPNGPRGAAEDEDLDRQEAKIVAAINTMDASVVSLEEIENSVIFGEDRDDALRALTEALNEDAGTRRWAFVPSPAAEDLPPVAEQDVIRTAFIYDPNTVQRVGPSEVLVGDPAFSDAREPLAQAFKARGAAGGEPFIVIANHFKSKSSGVDDGTGQGRANQVRVEEAKSLVAFADAFSAEREIRQVFLAGDFNAYSQEDPMLELAKGGFTRLESDTPDEWSYSFDGMSGSLDHVLANGPALRRVTGVDTWEINANEAVAFEYSRFNENITEFYEPNVFRASDHNPEIVGIRTSPR